MGKKEPCNVTNYAEKFHRVHLPILSLLTLSWGAERSEAKWNDSKGFLFVLLILESEGWLSLYVINCENGKNRAKKEEKKRCRVRWVEKRKIGWILWMYKCFHLSLIQYECKQRGSILGRKDLQHPEPTREWEAPREDQKRQKFITNQLSNQTFVDQNGFIQARNKPNDGDTKK